MIDDYIDDGELIRKAEAKRRWRDQIMLAFDEQCAYCFTPLTKATATLDHVQPKAKGGQTVRHNLVACCLRCNREKAHQDWRVWYATQPFYSVSQEAIIMDWLDS